MALKTRHTEIQPPDALQLMVDEVTDLQKTLPYHTGQYREVERMLGALNRWLNVPAVEASGNRAQFLNPLNHFGTVKGLPLGGFSYSLIRIQHTVHLITAMTVDKKRSMFL